MYVVEFESGLLSFTSRTIERYGWAGSEPLPLGCPGGIDTNVSLPMPPVSVVLSGEMGEVNPLYVAVDGEKVADPEMNPEDELAGTGLGVGVLFGVADARGVGETTAEGEGDGTGVAVALDTDSL